MHIVGEGRIQIDTCPFLNLNASSPQIAIETRRVEGDCGCHSSGIKRQIIHDLQTRRAIRDKGQTATQRNSKGLGRHSEPRQELTGILGVGSVRDISDIHTKHAARIPHGNDETSPVRSKVSPGQRAVIHPTQQLQITGIRGRGGHVPAIEAVVCADIGHASADKQRGSGLRQRQGAQ